MEHIEDVVKPQEEQIHRGIVNETQAWWHLNHEYRCEVSFSTRRRLSIVSTPSCTLCSSELASLRKFLGRMGSPAWWQIRGDAKSRSRHFGILYDFFRYRMQKLRPFYRGMTFFCK